MLLLTNHSYQPFLTLSEIHFPSTDQIYRPKFCQNENRKNSYLFEGHFGDIFDDRENLGKKVSSFTKSTVLVRDPFLGSKSYTE